MSHMEYAMTVPFYKHVTQILNQATGSKIPTRIVNAYMKGSIQVINLHIDSASKTIQAKIAIKEQPHQFDITVEGYELVQEDGEDLLRWSRIVVDGGAARLPRGLKDKLEFVM